MADWDNYLQNHQHSKSISEKKRKPEKEAIFCWGCNKSPHGQLRDFRHDKVGAIYKDMVSLFKLRFKDGSSEGFRLCDTCIGVIRSAVVIRHNLDKNSDLSSGQNKAPSKVSIPPDPKKAKTDKPSGTRNTENEKIGVNSSNPSPLEDISFNNGSSQNPVRKLHDKIVRPTPIRSLPLPEKLPSLKLSDSDKNLNLIWPLKSPFMVPVSISKDKLRELLKEPAPPKRQFKDKATCTNKFSNHHATFKDIKLDGFDMFEKGPENEEGLIVSDHSYTVDSISEIVNNCRKSFAINDLANIELTKEQVKKLCISLQTDPRRLVKEILVIPCFKESLWKGLLLELHSEAERACTKGSILRSSISKDENPYGLCRKIIYELHARFPLILRTLVIMGFPQHASVSTQNMMTIPSLFAIAMYSRNNQVCVLQKIISCICDDQAVGIELHKLLNKLGISTAPKTRPTKQERNTKRKQDASNVKVVKKEKPNNPTNQINSKSIKQEATDNSKVSQYGPQTVRHQGTSTMDSEVSEDNVASAIDNEVSQDNVTPAIDSEVSQDNVTSAIDNEVSQDNVTPAIDSEISQDNDTPALDSEVSQGNATLATDSEVSQGNTTPALDSEVSQGNTTLATDSEVSQGNTTPALDSEVSQGNATPALDSEVSQGNATPAVDSEVSQGNTTPAVDSEVSQGNTTPAVDSEVSQGNTTPAVDSEVSQDNATPAIDSEVSQEGAGAVRHQEPSTVDLDTDDD